ncbi:MAG: cyanophycinase [Bacteriovoracaceae bacterium]|nr:cyanophycinase [Bacteriovoracaceae bacterium]
MIRFLALLLLSTPLFASTLVLIGGGDHPKEALEAFLKEAKRGAVVVIPWGTSYPEESHKAIEAELEALGAKKVVCLCTSTFTAKDLKVLKKAGAIYFPGGDQNKIMARILQNNLKPVLEKLYQDGVPVAGTSAGTAIQSNPMLTGNASETSEGLGLLKRFIVDQHFVVRNREERLLKVLENNPTRSGMGVDESMSVVVKDDKEFTALGPSVVILYLKHTDGIQKIILKHLERYSF